MAVGEPSMTSSGFASQAKNQISLKNPVVAPSFVQDQPKILSFPISHNREDGNQFPIQGQTTSTSPSMSFMEALTSKVAPQDSAPAPITSSDFDFAELKTPTSIQGTPAILFNVTEQASMVSKFQYTLIGKFSHGKPKWKKVTEFFHQLKLKSDCRLSIFNNKHLYIVCSNRTDFYRLWLRLVWFIDGFPMRVFRWEPQFNALKESSIAPVWIRFEGLPLYMFDHLPLFNLSNVIGKPICIDARNLNGTMLNSARVCVELDVSKPLIDIIKVGFVQTDSIVPVEEIMVQVFYDIVPSFCCSCSHIGHSMDLCKRGTASMAQNPNHRPGKEAEIVLAAPMNEREQSHIRQKTWVPKVATKEPIKVAAKQAQFAHSMTVANRFEALESSQEQLQVQEESLATILTFIEKPVYSDAALESREAVVNAVVGDFAECCAGTALNQAAGDVISSEPKSAANQKTKGKADLLVSTSDKVIVVWEAPSDDAARDSEECSAGTGKTKHHQITPELLLRKELMEHSVAQGSIVEAVSKKSDLLEILKEHGENVSSTDVARTQQSSLAFNCTNNNLVATKITTNVQNYEVNESSQVTVVSSKALMQIPSYDAGNAADLGVRISDCTKSESKNEVSIAAGSQCQKRAALSGQNLEGSASYIVEPTTLEDAKSLVVWEGHDVVAASSFATDELASPTVTGEIDAGVISMEVNQGTCSTYDSSEKPQLTDSRSSGLENKSDWQMVTRNKSKRPIKTQARTIVVCEDSEEPGKATSTKKAELQVVFPYKSEADHHATPTRTDTDHQALPYTPTTSTIAQADNTFEELTPTKARQYVGQMNYKVQGAVTRAQTNTSNFTWADQVEEDFPCFLCKTLLTRNK